MEKKKILLIGGPTGVGKTKLGIECAKVFGGEIISCDCMQVYKKLDIGTAKASTSEQKEAKHHLIDIKEPTESYSCAEFKIDATKIIDKLTSEKKLPIIVGGTGLYIQSLLFPYNFSSSIRNEEIREKYRKLADMYGNQYVFDILKEKDNKACEKLHPNDLKRVIRALEIFDTTGKPKIESEQEVESEYDYKFIFLNTEREVLYERINSRVDKMFEMGLLEEVENVVKSYNLTRESQSMQGIGYREFFDYFENKITFDELKEAIKKDSRNYAKRQITWFRHRKNVNEYCIENINKILDDVKCWLKN
ncbi:MAG: tRNA (adenosine(37)-N6)-dimethylallyltransferase MiaA [Clostridiales bacterium]|nr:tRNA (adenosine(37)-N6)-dimethylallyltransferase MiaA [Candidatus Apopatousia equi]